MFRNLKIGSKILTVLVVVAVIAVGISGLISYKIAKESLQTESFNKLTAVREMKASQIEDYLQLIRDQIVTLSEDRMIIEAMKAFDEGLHQMQDELMITDKQEATFDNELKNYYQNEYLKRLTANFSEDVSLSNHWSDDIKTRTLQYLYIASNSNEVGSKDKLDNAGDGSSYSQVHEIYHPILRHYLEEFGYYDIFLVDTDTGGHIAYSVFKEVDYGTSLLNGPYKNTNLAKAYLAARKATQNNFVKLVDYEPYPPSYNEQAAFISSPIYDDNKKIGVLVFQMPIDRINNIMTHKQNWAQVGLGKSGETYLVGDDYKLRNQSRFLIEDRENYFKMIKKIGVPLSTINMIKNLNSTIGLQKVKTQGTEAALRGETGTQIFPDYRGVPVLSSYKPLNIKDVAWAIVSEIDESEAFAYVYSLRDTIIWCFVILILFIIIIGLLFSRSLTQPLKCLTEDATQLAKGNLDIQIDTSRQDEIGELANNFSVMQKSLRSLINELEEINRNLENKVAERTLELEQANARVKSIVENAAEAIITIDTDQKIVLFNPAAEKMFGYNTAEVLGQPLTVLIPQQSRTIHEEEVHRFRREAVTARTMDTRRETAGLRKDGTGFPAEAGICKMELVGQTFFTAFLRDITERKQAEEALRKLSLAVEQSQVTVVITDPDGTIEYANPKFCQLTGYSVQEAIGQNPKILNAGIQPSDYYKKMWDTIKSGDVWQGEFANKKKNGEIYWENAVISPIRNDKDTITHFVAVKEDITERKKAEQELQQAYGIIEAQKDRMEKELNVGREIQMSMLPLIFPAFPDRKELGVYAILEPAREVGGDFYDFFFLDNERFCFVIGDVSGKGVPSALFMAVTKTLIKSRAADDNSTASILTHVNEELSRDNKAYMFVTVFIGILNTLTGEMQYTNAGHNPPYIIRKSGSLEALAQRHGPVIGAVKGLAYKEDTTHLFPGDMAYLYTDGVTEAKDKNNSLFTEKRLENVLSSRQYTSTEDVVKATVEETKRFEQDVEQADDITVMAVEYYGVKDKPETRRFEVTIKNRLSEIEKAIQCFNAFSDEEGLDVKIRREIKMVFDEMLNNIISYAFRQDEEHEIEIKIELTGNRLTMILSDDGVPFNPFGIEAPDTDLPLEKRKIGGLGLHLVRNVMDEVSYQRKIEKNVVTLTKIIN
jgi:PAS domain S-box-containing protein